MSETNKNLGGGAGRMWPLFVGLPLIVAVAIIAVIFSGGERSQPSGQEQPSQSAREEQPSEPGGGREEAARGGARLGHPALGDADAPVVMIEYGDFQ